MKKLSKKNLAPLIAVFAIMSVGSVFALYILSNTYQTQVTLVDSTGCILVSQDTAFTPGEKFLGTDITGKVSIKQQDLDITEFYVNVRLSSSGGDLEVGDVTLDVLANFGASYYYDVSGLAFTLDGSNLLWKSPIDNTGFGAPGDLETCYYQFTFHTTSDLPEGDLTIEIWTSDS